MYYIPVEVSSNPKRGHIRGGGRLRMSPFQKYSIVSKPVSSKAAQVTKTYGGFKRFFNPNINIPLVTFFPLGTALPHFHMVGPTPVPAWKRFFFGHSFNHHNNHQTQWLDFVTRIIGLLTMLWLQFYTFVTSPFYCPCWRHAPTLNTISNCVVFSPCKIRLKPALNWKSPNTSF